MIQFLFLIYNISFITCIKGYIGHKSLEDQTLSRWNGCLTYSHSVTQPLNLVSLDRQTQVLSLSYFGQIVTRTKSHVFLVDCNQDPKPCNFKIFKHVFFYSISETEQFSHVQLYLIFSYFFCKKKKISGDSTPLTQKERCPKRHTQNLSLFLEDLILAISHSGDSTQDIKG